MRITIITGTAIALAVLSGCSVSEPSTAPLTEESATASAEAPKQEKEKADSEGPLPLTGTTKVGDAASVTLSGVKRGVSGKYGSPANTPYIQVTVKITNEGSAALDPAMFLTTCTYGDQGQAAEHVWDEGMGEPPTVKILEGKSSTATHACTFPKEESELQVQVEHVMDGESAVFQGTVE